MILLRFNSLNFNQQPIFQRLAVLRFRLFIKMLRSQDHPFLRLSALFLVVLFCAPSALGNFTALSDITQNPPETRSLQLGQRVERELNGGETHSYRIASQPGQFLRAGNGVADHRSGGRLSRRSHIGRQKGKSRTL
jgi:hypothetical protein